MGTAAALCSPSTRSCQRLFVPDWDPREKGWQSGGVSREVHLGALPRLRVPPAAPCSPAGPWGRWCRGSVGVRGTEPLALSKKSVLLAVFLADQVPLLLLGMGTDLKRRKVSVNLGSDLKVLES